jgi:glutamyl-Q tRNA(Asp) synthetase
VRIEPRFLPAATKPMSAESAAGAFQPNYVGRFAPSPTGSLHLGSLLAAVGSFVDARHHGGRWLVRMEDLDTARVVPGCADEMLRALEAFGLHWDGAIEYQSTRKHHYLEALTRLSERNLSYRCSCTRAERSAQGGYPGTCRSGARLTGPTATRFRVADEPVRFADRVQGECVFDLRQLGDVVVRRRDGTFAYQLAVVVDDGLQGVTDVVRGADLLDNTPWQLALQRALDLPTPRYAHLPLVVEPRAGKLAKSRRSLPLVPAHASVLLHEVLTLLGQAPTAELKSELPERILAWATGHWNLDAVAGIREVRAP